MAIQIPSEFGTWLEQIHREEAEERLEFYRKFFGTPEESQEAKEQWMADAWWPLTPPRMGRPEE